MYQFLVDMWAVLRLKFYSKAHYRYPLLITFLVLLTLGLINAASMPPLFDGYQAGVIGFAIALTALRWLILSMIMKGFLSSANSSLLEWKGYILVTEALMMPLVILPYWPEVMAIPGFLWLGWIMLVQLLGLVQISQQKLSKVVVAYIVYFLCASMAGAVLLFIFFSMDWLSMDNMIKAMEQMMDVPLNNNAVSF